MSTRLSVLMPVRNAIATAPLAASSTLRAMRDDDELLIHDDASEDGTVEALLRLDDRRIRIVRAEQPRGVAGGLNHLLEQAEGTLVARMDADDVTLPWRFALQRRSIARGADLVFTGHVRFGATMLDFKQKRPGALSAAAVRHWLALENPLLHPTMAGRVEVVRAAGGYRPGAAEDYDLWLRTATDGRRIVRLVTPALAYRMHVDQVTRTRGYGARVLADPAIGESHTAHARMLGWTGAPVWDVLNRVPVLEEEWSRKRGYWVFLRQLASSLPQPHERRMLLATIERAWPGVPTEVLAG